MNLTVPAAELAAALSSVRYAVGSDPAHPALHGVLLDAGDGTLHVVATDRYRLAAAAVPIAVPAATNCTKSRRDTPRVSRRSS